MDLRLTDAPPTINPDKAILARESRGLTQSDASKELRISQGRLSKIEAGLLSIPIELVERMSRVYHYPMEFFSLSDPVLGPGASEFLHRKRQSTSARKLRQLHAEMNVRMINVARLLRGVEIERDDIPRIDPEEFDGSIEEIARAVRAKWQLPAGPIANLTKLIEDAGGIVIPCDFGTPLLDAMSRYMPGLPRVFFVDGSAPGDRQRMTLAHELGHTVMHQLPHKEMEREAFRFAAEFLMPAADIRPQLDRVDLPKLASLKPYWKVAMSALLKRAEDVGKVTPRMARYLWMQMGKAGYRTHEPLELDIPPEEPRLLQEIIEVHRDELGYGLAELSDLVVLFEDEVQATFDVDPKRNDVRGRLRPVMGHLRS